VTRSLTILSELGDGAEQFRVFLSSNVAAAAIRHYNCPVDLVPEGVMSSRQGYYSFLEDYLLRHRIEAIALDTFPAGLLGEWAEVAPDIPRLMIARYLRWDIYRQCLDLSGFPLPLRTLAIEPLAPEYETMLRNSGEMELLQSPIIADILQGKRPAPENTGTPASDWVVVHSGPPEECSALVNHAKGLMQEHGSADTEPLRIFPAAGIFPAGAYLAGFRYVVSGAGYNMAAYSMLAPAGQRHFFLPFERRFDDQQLRLEKISTGRWLEPAEDGARQAASWLQASLRKLT